MKLIIKIVFYERCANVFKVHCHLLAVDEKNKLGGLMSRHFGVPQAARQSFRHLHLTEWRWRHFLRCVQSEFSWISCFFLSLLEEDSTTYV